jgi:ATP-dependent 26S proteasome regulatory subunit
MLSCHVVPIATLRHPHGRFDREIRIDVPGEQERLAILKGRA